MAANFFRCPPKNIRHSHLGDGKNEHGKGRKRERTPYRVRRACHKGPARKRFRVPRHAPLSRARDAVAWGLMKEKRRNQRISKPLKSNRRNPP